MFPEGRTGKLAAPGRQAQRGIGLPGAVFILVVLALLVVSITNLETQTGETLVQDVQSTRAFFAAETGAQAGLTVLFGPGESAACATSCASGFAGLTSLDFDSVSGGAPPGLATCRYTVTCCTRTDGAGNTYYTLQSEGRCGDGLSPLDQATRIVEVGARN